MAKEITWISAEEAAQMLGMKPRTLKNYIRENRLLLTVTRPHYRNLQVSRESVEKYKLDQSNLHK